MKIDLNNGEQVFGTLPPGNGGTGLATTGAAGNVPTSDGAGNWVSQPQSGGASKTYAFFAG